MAFFKRKRSFGRIRKEHPHKINNKIESLTVRLVGENVPQGVFDTRRAIEMAKEQGLDLVEISPNVDPPVCKIIDYQKYLYTQKKKKKELKAKTAKTVLKEIRFGPNTDEHDFQFKLNHAKRFLKDGCKLKAYVFFKGRQIIFKDKGEMLLLRLAQELEKMAKVEQLPKLEGKKMNMLLTPLN